jgi:hypothetical protein
VYWVVADDVYEAAVDLQQLGVIRSEFDELLVAVLRHVGMLRDLICQRAHLRHIHL